MVAGPSCRDAGVEQALPSRTSHNYRQRRNYEGFYWCAGSRSHVWYESMTEYTSLMYLDHTQAPSAVAAQPMWIYFHDGTKHCPDYFAVLRSGRRVVYDVKPVERIDAATQAQFDNTAAVCSRVGWGYEVLHGLPRVARHNLEWLAGYRHPWNAMAPHRKNRLLEMLQKPQTLGRAASYLTPGTPVSSLPGVANLLWSRDIACDLTAPLDWSSTVWARHV